jgi:copper chaperone CopZ
MKLSGVKHVAVDYAANAVLVSYDPDRLSTEDIREFLEEVA